MVGNNWIPENKIETIATIKRDVILVFELELYKFKKLLSNF